MLVESMNPLEINGEVLRDGNKLYDTTGMRLSREYDRERRKLKIDKYKTYPKVYSVKTHSKNTWLIFIAKAPAVPKYVGPESADIGYVAYYYNATGLRVFHLNSSEFMHVYNGHFFKRYNERMNLQLDKPIDIVKQYFLYGGYTTHRIINDDESGRSYTIGVSSEGILLGELQPENSWIINKTFINRESATARLNRTEHSLKSSLQKEMEKALATNTDTKIGDENWLNNNILSAIQGAHKD